jgi:hypothetical protein
MSVSDRKCGWVGEPLRERENDNERERDKKEPQREKK